MPVTITANDISPTKQHANSCWQNHPRLNPAAFRESLHFTAGKLWLDLRTYIPPRDDILLSAYTRGINAWLLSPRTLKALNLPATINREHLVLAVESPTVETPPQPLDVYFLRSSSPSTEALTTLEDLAKQKHILSYGIASETALPLHDWLAVAEAVAEKVHGRRKRPALRALLTPLNFTETEALYSQTCINHNEPVSPLEFAARLGWLFVAEHPASLRLADGQRLPLTAPTTPSPQALAALQTAATAEQTLHQQLGGWPSINNQPLFSLLAPLGNGEPPFASPASGLNWATYTLPGTLQAWSTLNRPEATLYIESLQRLAFHAASLGQAASAVTTAKLLATLPDLPPISANPALSATNLVTSLPGVAGALVTPEQLADFLPLMEQPDAPDPAPYFMR